MCELAHEITTVAKRLMVKAAEGLIQGPIDYEVDLLMVLADIAAARHREPVPPSARGTPPANDAGNVVPFRRREAI